MIDMSEAFLAVKRCQTELADLLDQIAPLASLEPQRARAEMLEVYEFGARKHGASDWLKNPREWSSMLSALRRHLVAFESGDDTDHESGLPAIAHVAVRAQMLLEYYLRGIGSDDRWRGAVSPVLLPHPTAEAVELEARRQNISASEFANRALLIAVEHGRIGEKWPGGSK